MNYPDEEIVREWINLISNEDLKLVLHEWVPDTDDRWVSDVVGCIDRVRLVDNSEQPSTHTTAARIFYKIAKLHGVLANGNKRSAVIILYLFYLNNGYNIVLQTRITLRSFKTCGAFKLSPN